MYQLQYVNRKNTNCCKWDGQTAMYGEEGLLPLWVADMDFKVADCITDALSNYVNDGVFGYYTIPDSYANAFGKWMRDHYHFTISPEWLRFSPGVVSAFHWVVQMLTKPGDAVLVQTPVYYPFLNAVNHNNRKLITSNLVNTNGVYTIDFHHFEEQIVAHNVKLYMLCSPHNPVGRVWTKQELEQMLAICRKHNVYVMSDEIHQDLTFHHTHIPTLSIPGYEDLVISMTAPSKTFNLAGCQNSIIVIKDPALQKVWDDFTLGIRIVSGNPFGYIAATAAYKDATPWFEEVKRTIWDNYLYMKDTLEKALPKIVITPLEGTYLAWIDMKAYISAEELHDFMQRKCGLAFDYGEWFGGNQFQTFIRMNLATSKENVETAVKRIIENI